MKRIDRKRVDKRWKTNAKRLIKKPYSFRLNPELMLLAEKKLQQENKKEGNILTLTGLLECLLEEYLIQGSR